MHLFENLFGLSHKRHDCFLNGKSMRLELVERHLATHRAGQQEAGVEATP